MGSNTGHTNKRFRILPTNRRMAQGTGRKGIEEENHQLITTAGRCGFKHGQGQQDLA